MNASKVGRVAAALLTLIASGSAAALTWRLGDSGYSFDAPGYCALDARGGEFDRLFLEWQQNANRGSNDVIAVLVDCVKLSALRSGATVEVGQYGIFLAPYQNGRLRRVEGSTRADFLDEAAKLALGGMNVDSKIVEKRVNDALQSEVRDRLGRIAFEGVRELGILHRDDHAIYAGLVIAASAGSERHVNAGVMALTLVKGYIVQLTMYRPFVDKGTIDSLLQDQIGHMANFVFANETPDERATNLQRTGKSGFLGFDWDSVLAAAVRGAVIGGVVGLAFLAFRWIRNRKGPRAGA